MKIIEYVVSFVKNHIKGILFFFDMVAVFLSAGAMAVLKFDGPILFPEWFKTNCFIIVPVYALCVGVSFFAFKVYNRMWQYVNIKDYYILVVAFCVAFAVGTVPFFYLWSFFTREYFTWVTLFAVSSGLIMLFNRCAVAAGYRFWRTRIIAEQRNGGARIKRVMIIGAGGAALRLIDELRGHRYAKVYKVVALIDDNKRKQGEYLNGIKVYGGREVIPEVVEKLNIDEIYFAARSAKEQDKKEILDICNTTGCVLKTLSGITDVKKKNGNIGESLRKVDYTDLLGREQIKPDLTKAFQLLENRTVLVTGGGGSIGGELVRQIAASGVAKTVIIFDIAENGAYDIQQELKRKYPDVDLKVLIGSVRDEKRLCEVFEEYRPEFVYHAAAHKHVPLMEESPKEAVKNNVFGTYNLAKTADKYGVSRFVMISTDKAVNPTNVMGATKRICEKIVQSFNKISETDYVAVRFGNVLGSNGSVIPLFKEQIESGGPVTVTHPDIIRYFMLIPEAVSLVLQAGAYAKGGEVFILDMGSPVKIRELAENLIRLSGYIPGVDIEIKYTGLRDGEKLYEELLISEEGIQKTQNDLIYVARPMEFDSEEFFRKLDKLKGMVETASPLEIVNEIKKIVPTFNPQNEAYKSSEDNPTREFAETQAQ